MTPNLGQGGCTALEDGIVLAQAVAGALRGSGDGQLEWSNVRIKAVEDALREFERQRSQRCLPLVVRSWAFGFALQMPYAPVLAARDWFVENAFSPAHFLDHTAFDCGKLPAPLRLR
jgi:2-polyprenyl-6-methoxyphenol hydroxylase-like FAD-dependent oxidoreductase